MWTKFLNWLKSLFKKFNFDNVLFAKGVDVVAELVKDKSNEIDHVGDLWDTYITEFLKHFNNYPAITKLISKAAKEINEKIQTMVEYVDAHGDEKVNIIAAQLKDWYNKHF